MSADTTIAARQAARRRLITMAGLLIVVLAAINLVALYGHELIRREASGFAAATRNLILATDRTRTAEVAFKTQVQEWKNVLLRGHDPADMARYRAGFAAQQAAVVAQLDEIAALAPELGFPIAAVERIQTMHAELATRYAEALVGFDPGTPEAAWRVDRRVRGMDRPLTEAFDALATEVRSLAEARRQRVQGELERVQAVQRRILIGAHGAGITLVLISAVVALRALRRR